MAEPLPPRWMAVLRRLAAEGRPGPSQADLATSIYHAHFARWRPAPGAGRASGEAAYVERLALAVGDAWGWESGWEITQRAGIWRFVHDGRMQLFVREGEFHPGRARVGQQVSVLMPCLREGLVPGFLYAFSRAGPIDPRAPHLRIYLDVGAERGAALLERLLTARAMAGLRFEAKLPNDPAAFGRQDSMVVYAEPGSGPELLRALLRWRGRGGPGWRAGTPFAAHPVAPGVAVAESPPFRDGEAQSFGQHRSGLMARAVWEGLQAGEAGPGPWAARLAGLLRAEGIDPARPYAQRLPPRFWAGLWRKAKLARRVA